MSYRQLRQMVGDLFRASPQQTFTAAGICHLLANRISPAPTLDEVENILYRGVEGDVLRCVGEGDFGPEYRLREVKDGAPWVSPHQRPEHSP